MNEPIQTDGRMDVLLKECEKLKELIMLKRVLEAGMGSREELTWCCEALEAQKNKLRAMLILKEGK